MWDRNKCANLESLSTTTITIMVDLPLALGSLSKKSIDMSAQTWDGIGSGCNKPEGWRFHSYVFGKHHNSLRTS